MAESPWVAEVRRAIGSRPDIMLWRQHAGTYAVLDDTKLLRDAKKIKVAVDGIADLMGVQLRKVHTDRISVMETVNPNSMQPHERSIEYWYGQAIAIEAKALKGRQRQTQLDFERAFTSCGGRYIVCHAGDWDSLWNEIGREPDPASAVKWHEVWAEIGDRRKTA